MPLARDDGRLLQNFAYKLARVSLSARIFQYQRDICTYCSAMLKGSHSQPCRSLRTE
jgi:hypothetical protein